MVKLTKKDLAIIAAGVGTADFLLEGKLSAPVARALKKYVFPRAGRGLARTPGTVAGVAGRALRAGKFVAVRHPDMTAGALVYYGYKNRKELGRLVEQGYDVIQPTASGIADMVGSGTQETTLGPRTTAAPKRKKSTFNKMVSKGVQALNASASYGKRGTINNAKAAFKTATQQASKAIRGKPAPKNGPGKVAYTASKKVYKDEILRRKMK